MLWDKRHSLSVDEFSLLMGGYDPIWIDTVEDAIHQNFYGENGLCDWESSKKWKSFLTEAIQFREFQGDEVYLVGSNSSELGSDKLMTTDQVSLDTRVNTQLTRIRKEPLARWVKNAGERLPYFLCSMEEFMEQTVNLLKFIESDESDLPELPSSTTTKQLRTPEQLHSEHQDPNLIEIQKLLAGQHEHQAEELALAIKAWLGVSKLWKQGRGIKTPKLDIADWLEDHADHLPDAAKNPDKGRIPTISNWEKKGGNKKAT